MFRTPAKVPAKSPVGDKTFTKRTPPKQAQNPVAPGVRRTLVDWAVGKPETVRPEENPPTSPKEPSPLSSSSLPADPKRATKRTSMESAGSSPATEKTQKFANRTSEAKACLSKAKIQLLSSRNLKKEIKDEITKSVERLYQLVKEAEIEKGRGQVNEVGGKLGTPKEPKPATEEPTELMKILVENLKDHRQALQECKQHTQALSEHLQQAPRYVAGQSPTFAEMAAGRKQHVQEPLHSVVVSSVNDQDTGEEVMEKLRTAVDARNEGTRVERLRKARDQKVVVGFRTREEMTRVTEKIKKAGNLVVEEVKNKDPQIIIRDVLSCHSDVEITEALQRQNSHLIGDIPAGELRLVVKYRRRTRNPHTCHVVLQVSPAVWQRLTSAGRVHIDLQRVRVQDQSPLVQCTRCLRFGHTRKMCTQPADLCIHCGDPHMRADCPSWLAAEAPRCHNCLLNKAEKTDHGAFDSECPRKVGRAGAPVGGILLRWLLRNTVYLGQH